MTDLEINKALALAIGWPFVSIFNDSVWVSDDYWLAPFDYRNWNVIGPIAERYDCFPTKNTDGLWVMDIWNDVPELSPQKAIALVVIQGAKQ